MNKTIYISALSVLFIFGVTECRSATIKVPSQFSTIQGGINAAASGDTVLVAAGTYYENIVWPDRDGIRLLSAGDWNNTIIDGNARGRVFFFGTGATILTNSTVVRGFTVRNGLVTDTIDPLVMGAGILCNFASPVFDSLIITANRLTGVYESVYGVGAYCFESSPRFNNCFFTYNKSVGVEEAYGGAICCSSNSDPVLSNVTISNNTLYVNSRAYGGGIYCELSSDPVLDNVTITSNTLYGGGGYFFGGGIYCTDYCKPVLNNVVIKDNFLTGSGSFFYGGGIYSAFHCNLKLTNVLIASNVFCKNGPFLRGGGIYCEDSYMTLTHVTISGNRNTDSSEIEGPGIWYENSGITVKNSILWNENANPEISFGSGSFNPTYSDIRGGSAGTGNINLVPQFLNPSDFHLRSISPCINAGTLTGAPVYDLEFSPRPAPAGTNPDMGAYEVDQVISVHENSGADLMPVKVYPNPVTDVAMVEVMGVSSKADLQFTVYDIYGRAVLSSCRQSSVFILQRGNLLPGIYVFEVSSGYEVIGKGKVVVE